MRVNVQKRGKVYQYRFEIPRINGKRKFISKSGFRMRREALLEGQKAMDDGGINSNANMLYADYLDYWIKEYCEVELKYTTAKRYKETTGAIKNELGNYKLRIITSYMINQALLRLSQKVKTKEALRNYQKVIRKELEIEDCRFYDLRGSFATKALRSGVEIKDVADILGHSRIETTENYYISSLKESRKEATELFEKQITSQIIDKIAKFEIK